VDIKAVGADIQSEPIACAKLKILYLIVIGILSFRIAADGIVKKGSAIVVDKNNIKLI